MPNFKLTTDPRVTDKFNSYPKTVRTQMENLRALLLEAASEIDTIKEMEETLKWGEPSYLVKKGSTIRIDWKPKTPDRYAMYFKCTSKLVPTFKAVYGDVFEYEDNRAIRFNLKDRIPKRKVKDCIKLALTYHSVKHLPLLGK